MDGDTKRKIRLVVYVNHGFGCIAIYTWACSFQGGRALLLFSRQEGWRPQLYHCLLSKWPGTRWKYEEKRAEAQLYGERSRRKEEHQDMAKGRPAVWRDIMCPLCAFEKTGESHCVLVDDDVSCVLNYFCTCTLSPA